MLGKLMLGLQVLATYAIAESPSKQGFCFGEHLPGYYAVVQQTASERSEIDRNRSSLILSTDGLSGVKSGLFIGSAGAYLDKKEAEAKLKEVRKQIPDSYLKFLGTYTNVPGDIFDGTCANCWSYSSGKWKIRGRFLSGKGWLLHQAGGADYLLESRGEPAEDELCLTSLPENGWLLSEELGGEEGTMQHRFRLLSYSGAIEDEKVFLIGDGPTYQTVEVIQGSELFPKIVLKSNGTISESWSVVKHRFVKTP